ncbi:MAG TPA: c-type cytochrome [Burkholderiaceae bacterium]|nr:c-type cytochrome [Burkholderiaceae bacterium]
MRGALGVAAALVAASTSAPAQAPAQAAKTGQAVYQQTCAVCHATGVADAPKFGDVAQWKPLIEEGQAHVTAHGWVGVRAMPPRGGDSSLSLEEFARAVAYMARAAGADWRDPDPALLTRIANEASEAEKKR